MLLTNNAFSDGLMASVAALSLVAGWAVSDATPELNNDSLSFVACDEGKLLLLAEPALEASLLHKESNYFCNYTCSNLLEYYSERMWGYEYY